ncbi:MAG TPA: hypothetical protein VK726_20490 [Acetobacteraceae bacterium]|jgi:hypothetical protein|nr:hypothetical protein [Acetobacteraceae bacterium]
MTCARPICFLLRRIMQDGSAGLLMASDLPTALANVTQAEQDRTWRATHITFGRAIVLQGETLRTAIAET